MDLIKLHELDSISKRRNLKIKKARAKYGVHSTDAWCFDGYIARVISNGLRILSEETHGAPPGYGVDPDEYGPPDYKTDFDKWREDLKRHSDVFKRYADANDEHWKMHESLDWPEEEPDFVDENGYATFYEGTEYGEVFKKWTQMCKEYNEETDRLIKESLAWFSEHFQHLWD